MCLLCFVWLLALWVGAAPPKDLSVSVLAWSEDGAMLAVGSNNGDVTLYSGEGPRLKVLPRQVGAIRGLFWRGQELISVSSDGTIRSSARLDPLVNAGYLSKVERGGSRLALFGFNGLQIFDLEQDQIIARAKMPLEQSAEFAIDPQGGYLSVKEPEACVLFDASSGQVVQRIAVQRGVVGHAFSQTGSLLVNAGKVVEYTVPKGELVRDYAGDNPRLFRLSPDGRSLLVCLANSALIYPDREDSPKSVTIPLAATEFAGDNCVLQVGAQSRVVTYSGEKVITFELPRKYCQVYAINPRRTWLAVGLGDGGMRLFPLYK